MEQQFKQIDLGDLKPFAKGGTGECYRINEDTIIKLYYEGFPVDRILHEKDGARAALVAGVPTAISFDLVQARNRLGVMFELIQGRTLSELVVQDPDRAPQLGGILASIGKTLHNAEVRKTDLPSPTLAIRKELVKIDYMSEEAVHRIEQYLNLLDQEKHYVHGDLHPNNVVVSVNGPMLVDMGGFSVGSAMFDLASLRFSLFESPDAKKEGRSSFNGMSHEEEQAFYQGFMQTYFGGEMDPAMEEPLYMVTLLKKIRFERLYGARYPEEYCADIRREVRAVFDK